MPRGVWSTNKEIFDAYGAKGLERQKKYLDMLKPLLDKHGVRLSVGVYPWPNHIHYNDIDSIQVKTFSEWCANNGAHFVNLFPPFMKSKDTKSTIDKYFIANDIHLSEAGHQFIGDELVRIFQSETELAKSSSKKAY